jgi:hypothetical protein
MSDSHAWAAVIATLGLLVLYELVLAAMHRWLPHRLARTVHATLRAQWFEAVSGQRGSEILAVQTLRNSMMSATMLASTAALALMGTITLAVPSLHATFADGPGAARFTPRLALEFMLLALLFASLVSTVMAVRFYNHAGFVAALPVDSELRRRWSMSGVAYVRKAGILYSAGLRHLVLVVPAVAALLAPVAGPIAAAIVAAVLLMFDRVPDAPVRR